MSFVRDVLATKGGDVATIDRDSTVLEAARRMRERHIGSLVVMSGGRIVGIFTERDMLYRIVAAERDPASTLVCDVMTDRVAFCASDTPLEACRTAMTRNRIRHLPVVEDGSLRGMISSGDILARELEDQQETIRWMHEYMHGAT